MLDRGATMTVKDSINCDSNILDIGVKMLNNHSYNKFTNNKLDNTSQDTYVYRTDEQINKIYINIFKHII